VGEWRRKRLVRDFVVFPLRLRARTGSVHQEELDVTLVVDEELLVAAGKDVTGLLVRTVTDRGHGAAVTKLVSSPPPISRSLTAEERKERRTHSCPLKRRRTLLSIPLGLRHASFTPA
jgi:hypothetical protein